jgi:hypothetical protein
MALVTLGVTGTITLLGACGTSGAAKAKATESLACPTKQLTFEGIDSGEPHFVFVATGCTKKDIVAMDTSGEYASLRERATYELQCSAGELAVAVIDSNTFGVTGCNHQVVYKYHRRTGFVLNSSSKEGTTAN